MAEGDFNVKAIISADTKNFDNGMKKAQTSATNLSNTFGNLSKVITKALSFAGLGVGIKAITDFGKASVNAAENANKSLNILNNTLKVTGATAWTTSEEMVKMSEDIAYSTNYTVGEIQDMQSVLLGFRNITGETFKEASDAVTDMATVMGMDLKSAVQTVGKALDDPIKGLDSLRRQGFAFTEEQKAELEVLVRNGEQLKAQKIILDELNSTYGGAAKAAQSAFDKQKDSVIKFKETLGNQLMPVMNKFAESSAATFNKLTEFVKKIDFVEIAATIEYTVDIIKEYLNLFYENFKELFRGLGIEIKSSERFFETWKNNLYNIFNEVYKQIQLAFGFIKALINGDWKLAWEYAKIYVLDVCKKILDGLDNLLAKMPDLVNGAIKGLNAYYEAQDKVLIDFFHLPEKYFKAPRIGLYNGENLIDTKSIQEEIDKATKYIEEATGKQVTINLTGLEEIDNKRKEYQKNAEEGEIHLTSTTEIQVKKRTSLFSQECENIIASWKKVVEDLKNKTKDWTGVITSVLSEASNAFGEMFTMIGENLVGAGHSYEDFASVALNSLAQVLQSLGAQLAAIAAVKAMSYSYGEAVAAASASAAAFVASGVATGMAERLKRVKIETQELTVSLEDSVKAFENLKKAYEDVVNSFTKTTSSFKGTRTNIDAVLDGLREQLETVQKAQADVYKEAQEYYEKYLKPYEYEASGKKYIKLDINSQTYLKKYKEMLKEASKYGELYNDILAQMKEAMEQYNSVISDINENYKAQIAEVDDLIDSYNYFYEVISNATNSMLEYNVIYSEQLLNVKKLVSDVYTTITHSGQEIGTNIVSAILDGATKQDFLTSMKEYIRTNLIKIAIYTESFQDKLAKIGTKLSTALITGGNIKEIKDELSKLWDEAEESAKKAEDIITDVFGEMKETVSETMEDLGDDIASNLVDGISNGLSQSDFLDNMKKWIRKMLIQSVVYTESMKSEIEAIGQAITKGISEGFTETTFHEIRRDLSWVFNQANQTIEGIDNILNSVFSSGYATGTNNAASGLHLVGEQGPELVKFRGGEQVLNAADTNKALSGMGKTINQNITFNNLQDTTAYAMMNQLKQYNRQMAINGVI